MNELESPVVVRRGGLNSKTLWRQAANLNVRDQVHANAGRQQQSGKNDFLCSAYSFGSSGEAETGRTARSAAIMLAKSFTGKRAAYFRLITGVYHIKGHTAWESGRAVVGPTNVHWQSNFVDAFLEPVKRLEKRNHIDAALDVLYDRVDDLLVGSQFAIVDSLLMLADVDSLSIHILLGLLTATLPAKSKLQARSDFFKKAENALKTRGEWEDNLLSGLES